MSNKPVITLPPLTQDEILHFTLYGEFPPEMDDKVIRSFLKQACAIIEKQKAEDKHEH